MVTLYTVYADDIPVYLPKDLWDDDYEGEKVTPTVANLTMEDNKSGSFEFSILPQHQAYDEIELITTTIKVTEYVYDDDGSLENKNILWKGRVISIEDDMDGTRTFTCEGALAFLNDIICYPITNAIVSDVVTSDDGYSTAKAMKNEALRQALQDYLDDGGNTLDDGRDEGTIFRNSSWVNTQEFKDCIYTVGKGYNEMASFGRTFRVGKVTIGNNRGVVGFIDATEAGDGEYLPEDHPDGAWMFKGELTTPTAAFASALDQILDVTVDLNGGHLRVRHEEVNGEERMYLDYLGDFTDADSSAEYGVNIIEFNGKIELNSPVTDIIPRGATISTWNGNEAVDDAVDTSVFHIGDNVTFTGTYHYVASTSDVGYKCTPGYARITNLNFGAKHPIHLIHTGTDSTVYGWVNQSDIKQYSSTQPFEFVGRHYESYPYTEYTGIANNGYNYGLHVVNESLMSKYGRIQQTVDFPEISDQNELLEAAEEWLEAHSSFLKQTYEISLVDLGHVYGSGETPIHLLDRVHVSMPNHDIDEYMPVTKIELDLLNPANTTISFSRETNRSTVRRARSRAAAAVTDPSVQLNQPNDSISQSLARNIQYISETSTHAAINTSLSQNNKITLPDGKTGNFDLVESGTNNIAKLTFVNGLLCTTGKAGGPEYDIFTNEYIKGPGIIKPANDTMYLRAFRTANPGHHYDSQEDIFNNDMNASGATLYVPVNGTPGYELNDRIRVWPCPYSYTNEPNSAVDLILETSYGSKEYGLYYRLVDGEKKYFAMPCIYYLPSAYTGDIYVFYAGKISDTNVVLTKKIANLGNTIKNNVASMFLSMFGDTILPEMANSIKLSFRERRPTYTVTSDIVSMPSRSYSRAPCTALLILPLRLDIQAGSTSSNLPLWELFTSPALIIESDNYSYINGVKRPTKIKIYNGRNDDSVPRNYKSGKEGTFTVHQADMFKEYAHYVGDMVQTTINTAKYYLFTSKTDLDAIVEDYKSGTLSQNDIETKYRDKIMALRNGYNPNNAQTKIKISYIFNGVTTSYYVDGSSYDPGIR